MQSSSFRWAFSGTVTVLLLALPFTYYRMRYDDGKRLRVVTPGKLYRSGQLTAAGLDEAVLRFGIRTVLNFRSEATDPRLTTGEQEHAFLQRRGVKFHYIWISLLDRIGPEAMRPCAVDEVLELMDDPGNFPMLIHCQAGLHRTGVVAAIYRMEYEGWTREEALRELRLHGFGDCECTARNDYVNQYVLRYQPRSSQSSAKCEVLSAERIRSGLSTQHSALSPDSRQPRAEGRGPNP